MVLLIIISSSLTNKSIFRVIEYLELHNSYAYGMDPCCNNFQPTSLIPRILKNMTYKFPNKCFAFG